MSPVENYTPFRTTFPGFALIDALTVIKGQNANTPDGRLQLAHSAVELALWGLHATLEAPQKAVVGASFVEATNPLSDEQAMALLELGDDANSGKKAVACPISPDIAIKLAVWLFRAAEVVIPLVLRQ